MRNFGITGVGMYVPDKILTNEEIESWGIGTSDKWIYENSGIKERRIAASDQLTSDLAVSASEDALKNAAIKPSEIDLIVVATLTPDFLLPQTSSIIRKRIGAVNATCFDVQAACAGYVFAIINAVNYAILNDEVNNILVIGADTFSKVTDWTNRKYCSIIGDGAGAFVIRRVEETYGIRSNFIYTEDIESPSCGCLPVAYGKVGGGTSIYYSFAGKYLYERAKVYVPWVVNELLKKADWKTDDVKLYIFPQININFVLDIARILNIPEVRTHAIMRKYGYTFDSCLPITVYDALNNNKLTKGDKVILVGSGVGNYCASVALEWGV